MEYKKEILGSFIIENYTVEITIESIDPKEEPKQYEEDRELITYFDLYGKEITKERYYGFINDKYLNKTTA